MSGVIGSACCCEPGGQPCIGSSADCAAVAIVVEGFMSYGISSSTDELRREVRICQQSCGPDDPWPASEGESNRTNVASFAETARSRFKALLVKGAFGGAGNSYSTQNAGSQFRPIATMDFSVSASSAFRHAFGRCCLPQSRLRWLRIYKRRRKNKAGRFRTRKPRRNHRHQSCDYERHQIY